MGDINMTQVEEIDPIYRIKFNESKMHQNSDLKAQKSTIGSIFNSID